MNSSKASKRSYARWLIYVGLTAVFMSFQNCGGGFKFQDVNAQLASLNSATGGNNPTPINPVAPVLGLLSTSVTTKQGGNLEFTVSIRMEQATPVVVSYEALSGTALLYTDFLATKGTVTIPVGQTTAKVVVPTLNNNFMASTKALNMHFSVGSERTDPVGQIEPLFAIPKLKTISVGWGTACGITLTDQVMCWGNNSSGEAGTDPAVSGNFAAPAIVPGLVGVKKVISGSNVSCAVTAQDTVKCWGSGSNLGANTTVNSYIPLDVVGLGPIKGLSNKSNSTCAITAQDTVKCWGYNYNGHFGNGTNPQEPLLTPVESPGFAGAKAISVGYEAVCVVTAQNTVKCAGSNLDGVLGNNSTTPSLVPVDVLNLTNVKDIATGDVDACALLIQGTVKCWGRGGSGQLGNNSLVDSYVPVDVLGLTGIVEIQTDLYSACATTSLNTKKCWGSNTYGVLGPAVNQMTSVPVDMNFIADAKAYSISSSFACAVAGDDSVKCWGGVPHSTYLGFDSLAQMDVPELSGSKKVVLGVDHNCLITAQDTAKCWGINKYGNLGNNTVIDSITPVDVTGLTGVKDIALNRNGNCALLAAGNVKCWGLNSSGQLGNNTTTDSLVPVDVIGITGAKALAGNSNMSCVISAQDTVKCWGSSMPLKDMVGATGIASIVLGQWGHACALTIQKTVKCWGVNNFGQVGTTASQGNFVDPIDVLGLADVKKLALGGYHSCAILNSGAAKCWGYNYAGELGNNSDVSTPNPVDMIGVTGATEISAGGEVTCVIDAQGITKCAGYNNGNLIVANAPLYMRVAQTALNGAPISKMIVGQGSSLTLDGFGRWRTIGPVSRRASAPVQLLVLK